MEIRDLTSDLVPRWQGFVSAHASLFHDARWREVITGSYGMDARYLLAMDDGKIRGILPLFLIRGWWKRPRALSLPYLPYAGIAALDGEAYEALHAAAVKLARKERCSSLEYRTLEPQAVEANLYTFIRPLEETEDLVWKNLGAKVRNQTRKAAKSQVVVEKGVDYLSHFYLVHVDAVHNLGTPPHSWKFFSRLREAFEDSLQVLAVFKEGKCLGAMLLMYCGATAYDAWAYTLRDYDSLCPNNLLYWAALQESVARHCRFFDFGRSSSGSGTFSFKKHWGGSPVALRYVRLGVPDFNQPREQGLAGERAHQFSRIWKRLPRTLTVWLGPELRRCLVM